MCNTAYAFRVRPRWDYEGDFLTERAWSRGFDVGCLRGVLFSLSADYLVLRNEWKLANEEGKEAFSFRKQLNEFPLFCAHNAESGDCTHARDSIISNLLLVYWFREKRVKMLLESRDSMTIRVCTYSREIRTYWIFHTILANSARRLNSFQSNLLSRKNSPRW